MSSFQFNLLSQDPGSRARRGRLQLCHGAVETPVFMPVGTRATVTGMTTKTVTGMDFAMPDSVESYVELAKAITAWKGEELYGTAMTGQQVSKVKLSTQHFGD